jgi:sulfite exporter TauE/SafE
MTGLLASVLIASLLGSAHCAGMCGAFLAFAVMGPSVGADAGDRKVRTRGTIALHGAYHAGRLLSYATLGAIGGGLGHAIDSGGATLGVQRIGALLAGLCMIVFALIALLRMAGVRVSRVALPGALTRLAMAGHRRASELPGSTRALATGLLTTLLPCGWLYAFVIVAAGTGSPMLGALTMGAFWMGTLPVLMALGAGLQRLSGPLRRRLPALTMTVVLVMGLLTAFGRVGWANGAGEKGVPICHGE